MASDYSVEAFLAREQAELAGIDDEFGALTTNDSSIPSNGNLNNSNGTASHEPVVDLDFGQINNKNPEVIIQQDNGFGFENGDDGFLNESSQQQQQFGLGQEKDEEEAKIVDMDETALINDIPPTTLSALPLAQQTAMRRVATPTPPPTRDEPAKIKTWREQQKDRLEKKDINEENEKKKLREQAKRELDEWNKNRKEQLEKVMKRNRDVEKELMTQRDAEQPGKEWERVAGLCEFNPKSARATRDLTRFRSILLQMKNQPQK